MPHTTEPPKLQLLPTAAPAEDAIDLTPMLGEIARRMDYLCRTDPYRLTVNEASALMGVLIDITDRLAVSL